MDTLTSPLLAPLRGTCCGGGSLIGLWSLLCGADGRWRCRGVTFPPFPPRLSPGTGGNLRPVCFLEGGLAWEVSETILSLLMALAWEGPGGINSLGSRHPGEGRLCPPALLSGPKGSSQGGSSYMSRSWNSM